MRSPFPDDLISAYLDGELNTEERARVEEQLRDDAHLQRLFEELRALSGTLQSMPVASPPEGFSERVLRQAERRMLLGQDEPNPTDGTSRRDAPADSDPAMTEKRATPKRHWRFIVPLISTVAALLLIAVFVFEDPLSFREKRRVARGVDGEMTERAGTAADSEKPVEDNLEALDPTAETQDSGNASEALGTAGNALKRNASVPMEARDMSPKATDAPADDRAAGSDMQRSRKKEMARPRRNLSGGGILPGGKRPEASRPAVGRTRDGQSRPRPEYSSPSADQDGSAPHGLSLQQHEYDGAELADQEPADMREESALERSTASGSTASSSTASSSTAPAPRQGPGTEGDKKKRGAGPGTLAESESGAASSERRGPRQAVPAAPPYGVDTGGMGGMGGMSGMDGMSGGIGRQPPKDSYAPPEPAAEPLQAEEPAESATVMDALAEGGDFRTMTASQLAEQLGAHESLWVQVSVSHDVKMDLVKSKRNDEDRSQFWRDAARRLLGTQDEAQVELKVSSASGRKLPAKNRADSDLSFSYSGEPVVLVEGTKENLRGSLARLVSRSDIRINQVSTTSARELEHVRGLVEPGVEQPSAQQEWEGEATVAGEETERSKTNMELDQRVPARQESAEEAPVVKGQHGVSPPRSALQMDRKEEASRPTGMDARRRGDGQPTNVDPSSIDTMIDEAVRKSVRRLPAGPRQAPATETVLHFVFRCMPADPPAAARESPSGPSPPSGPTPSVPTPVVDPPESEGT